MMACNARTRPDMIHSARLNMIGAARTRAGSNSFRFVAIKAYIITGKMEISGERRAMPKTGLLEL